MKINPEVSAKIANMGIVCAFLVLFIHLPTGGNDFVGWYFSRGIDKMAVPFFFMASGYLLADISTRRVGIRRPSQSAYGHSSFQWWRGASSIGFIDIDISLQ